MGNNPCFRGNSSKIIWKTVSSFRRGGRGRGETGKKGRTGIENDAMSSGDTLHYLVMGFFRNNAKGGARGLMKCMRSS